MRYVKITNPNGSVNVVPEQSNKAYYEKLNLSIKEENKKYKIESPTDEDIKKYLPDVHAEKVSVDAANKALKEKEDTLSVANQKVSELEDSLKTANKEKDELKKKADDLYDELNIAKDEIVNLKGELKLNTDAQKKLNSDLEVANKKVEELQKKADKVAAASK